MAKGFDRGDVTLAAATATQLSALLVAEGYLGSMIGAFLEIDPQTVVDLYRSHNSSVSPTTGRAMTDLYSRSSQHPRQPVDPGRTWLYSTAGGEIGVTFESY